MADISLKLESKGIDLNLIADEQEKALKKAIKGLAQATYDDIVDMAQKTLITSRQDYIKSLDFQNMGNVYLIVLKEPGIHFENGFEKYDMKPGLLNGPKARVSKSGIKYNIIPFRHYPKSKARLPARLGPDYQSQLKETMKTMQKIAPREIRDRSGQVVGQIIARAKKGIEGYTAGMVRVQKEYKQRKQSTYLTFRVVSGKSPNDSWIHPGLKKLDFFGKAEKILEERMDDIINVIFGV